jgi:hypothetical protein
MDANTITVDFSTFTRGNLVEFADNAIGLRDWLTVTGQRDSAAFRAADGMWQAARRELEARGALADFEYERGMN